MAVRYVRAGGSTVTSDDWRKVVDLGLALANGADLPQDPEMPELLRRMAPQVGMTRADADSALASAADTASLVREIHRRTREGSYRLGRAFGASDSLKASGDRAGARKVLEHAMAAEVVPLYRAQIQAYLDHVDEPDDT
ncbi:DUF2379 domain-containing protein [Corallococcus sp. CA054B]|uniref:DUSAM domain-containing protein n=1 Tax=Corallococcus sp. CA054B TaxID=2316734 RepID=UPI000EA116D6|nr:DUF2379 family protein [Corallococcus sp. CA054B]RKG66873.1 DUF2379 domain-containing protein [Corallococcus sp. CA054B]